MALNVVSPFKTECSSVQGVQRRVWWFKWSFFRHFQITFVCSVDAILDIVHDI